MKKIILIYFSTFLYLCLIVACNSNKTGGSFSPDSVTLSKTRLQDKIKGGWAGQTFGVTYGGPTEFKYNSRFIPDSIKIPWPVSGYCKEWFDKRSWLYDDLYMDLTFVEVFEKYGIDTNVDSFAIAFAKAEYGLSHANQAARYNILNGIMPPGSGYWENNPHADDIDFQIESDFAGLMSPGMPVAASEICDKIGHIMTYGDGWYGGVYVSAMYSLAFIRDDIGFIVREALKMIPPESDFYQCMNDVIGWSEQFADWKQTWQKLENKWGNDLTCPLEIFNPGNIEAKMNCAYIIMGLLYGNGDMGKTVEITTRCGADSDCNPSNAAGILGTVIGYSNISEYWLNNVKEVEDQIFPFTHLSLKDTYKLSMKHALQLIGHNKGKIKNDEVVIKCQVPKPVRFEKSFDGFNPVKKEMINKPLDKTFSYSFKGSGVLIAGQFEGGGHGTGDYVANVEVFIDNQLTETMKLPADMKVRKHELYWNFKLTEKEHTIKLKLLNPIDEKIIMTSFVVVYSKRND